MPPPTPSFDSERILAELGWVRALAHSLVRDPGIAEDAVQEAWLLALERPPRTQSQRGLRAWLAQVTRTLVRSRVRSERARSAREERVSRPEASVPSAREVVARTQLQQRVVAAVMALAEPYRSAVLLRHVDGLSAREIAARQGTTVENARQRVGRGLEQLRRALDREHGGDGRSWVLALVPFLRSSGAPALLGSSIAMKTTTTIAAALAAAILGVLFVRRELTRVPSPSDGAERDAAEPLALAPADGPTPAPPLLAPPTDARHPVDALNSPTAPSAVGLIVHARLLDASGKPLAGAELAQPAHGPRASAGADGSVELVLDAPALTHTDGRDLLAFVARSEHCRATLRYEELPHTASEKTLELGEIRLYPIGALGGIVRNSAGVPIAGAEVRLELPSAVQEPHARLFGPDYSLQERRLQAGGDGRFLYDDVSAGMWCVWAGASGMGWTRSEVLRVEPANGVQEFELVLEPLSDSNLIHGLVRATDGAPLGGIEVQAFATGESDARNWAVSDARGRFVLAVEAGVAQNLRAAEGTPPRGRQRHHGAANLEGVRAGGGEVVLVLPDARWLEVEVTEPGGLAARGALVRERHGAPEGDGHYPVAQAGEHAGLARVLVPEAPFTLEVRSEDYALTTRGPFDPLTVPATLAIELTPLPHVRGVVHADGAPLANARVQLMKLPAPGEVYSLYGFPARLDGEDLRGTTSDENGRFELTVPFTMECALLAEKDGYAAVERSPLVLDPAHDTTLDLELGHGGAVEGHVLVAEGEDPAGILVRLCRGDMRVHEAATDSDGAYRIATLTPGPYMVLAERKRAGQSFGFAASPIERIGRDDFTFPWALDVRAGETTRYDVDLAEQELGEIAGSLRIDGAPPLAATARLLKGSEPWWQRRFDDEQMALGADGAFAFEQRRREPLLLVLEPGAGALLGTTIVEPLELARGENTLAFELASAALRGRLPSGESGPFALLTEPAPGAFAVTPIPVTAGSFALASVPACAEARLMAWRTGAERGDPRTWSEVARVALPAGRETIME